MKNGLNYLIRNDLSFSSPEIEILFLEIKGSTAKPKLIGCVYRPPNTDVSQFNDRIESCLNTLDNEKKDIHLMGDFNVNLLNHHSHNKTNEFIETMFSYGLYPLISKPTRISTRSCTLIDNIFLNDFYKNVETGLLYTDISDHFPIFCLVVFISVYTVKNNGWMAHIQLCHYDNAVLPWGPEYMQDTIQEIYNQKYT